MPKTSVPDGRVQKKKQLQKPGNNVYGSKGKPKCFNCRNGHRRCHYKSPSDDCVMCVRRGLLCGLKTRRGGAQETVRISVLKQLSVDYPAFTLKDAIEHLQQKKDAKIEYAPSCYPCSPEPSGYNTISCPSSLSQFDFMDQPITLHGVSLDFLANSGVGSALLRKELSQSCNPEDHSTDRIPGTPQWPICLDPCLVTQCETMGLNVPDLTSPAVDSLIMTIADCRTISLKKNGVNCKRQPTETNDPVLSSVGRDTSLEIRNVMNDLYHLYF